MTRAILFEYLNSKRVPINGQAEKATIISRILELWASSSEVNASPSEIQTVEFSTAQEMTPAVPPPVTPEMGLKFTQWFYEILLAVHKQTVDGSKLSEQFWRDVRLKITLNSTGAINCQEAIGSDEVTKVFSFFSWMVCNSDF